VSRWGELDSRTCSTASGKCFYLLRFANMFDHQSGDSRTSSTIRKMLRTVAIRRPPLTSCAVFVTIAQFSLLLRSFRYYCAVFVTIAQFSLAHRRRELPISTNEMYYWNSELQKGCALRIYKQLSIAIDETSICAACI
jgi:hypothetical protein